MSPLRTVLAFALFLGFAGAGSAAEAGGKADGKPSSAVAAQPEMKPDWKGALAVEEESQANYVVRNDKKSQDLICNVLPVLVPGRPEARMEMQVELTGQQKGKSTFQLQTSVKVPLGVEKVLVDTAETRVSVKVAKLD
ncbi:MAG: hypothetical protein HZB91_08870 [Elusimicrobia bacterium]|nr:hypothetical protein [Elusimicrobiota bacterium]